MKILELAKETGVYQLKKSFGKESMGIVRTTFIIDEQGKSIRCYRRLKVKTQIEELKTFWGDIYESCWVKSYA